jgi:CDP-glucose 4,6-dehydratase
LLAKNLYEGKREFSGAWNFGPDKKSYLTVENLVKEAIKIFGKGSYTVQEDFAKHEAASLKLNSDKAWQLLGWCPAYDLRGALEITCEWYEAFYNKEDIKKITQQQIGSFFKKITK